MQRTILDIEGRGLACLLSFNGVPLAQHALREPLARSFVVDGWVVDGPNALSLSLAALPPDPKAPPPPEPRFSLRLRQTTDSATSAATAERTLDYGWTAAGHPLTPTPGVAFSANPVLKPAAAWAWTRALPMAAPSAEDRREILGQLAGLHDALQRQSVDEVLRYQQLSLAEQALATGADPGRMLDDYAAFLRERMGAPDWALRPVDWAQARSVPLANGRVHRITDARGAPPIFANAAGSSFAIDPCMAKLDGRWVIVR